MKDCGKFHKEMLFKLLTSTSKRFVNRTHVDSRQRGFAVGNGYHPDNSHLRVELFGTGFSKLAHLCIPTCPFQKQTVDEAADVGPHSQLCYRFLHNLKESSTKGNQTPRMIKTYGSYKNIHTMLFRYARERSIPMFDLLRYTVLLLMVYQISSLL